MKLPTSNPRYAKDMQLISEAVQYAWNLQRTLKKDRVPGGLIAQLPLGTLSPNERHAGGGN